MPENDLSLRALVEQEVHRVFDSVERERESAVLETLKSHRDFMIDNTRWVVRGFFGILILFGALVTFIVGTQVESKVIEFFINPEIEKRVNARIDAYGHDLVEQEKSDIKDEISQQSSNLEKEAIERLRNYISEQTEVLIDDTVKERVDFVLERFSEEELTETVDRLIPRGAVLAFDRSESGDACPQGWSLFLPAGGRFIVGAGNHSNSDELGIRLTTYPAFRDDLSRATGGAERHTLTLSEMPQHSHETVEAGDSSNSAWGVGAPRRARQGVRWDASFPTSFTAPAGDTQPHNNMPPYIALYFCKKEG